MTAQYPTVPGVVFKEVPGFPGYCVGDDGSLWTRWKPGPERVFRDWRRTNSRPKRHGRTRGYIHVSLAAADGARRWFQLQCLILEVFVGPRPPGMEACHANGIRHDNRPENLELWVTPQPSGQRPEDLAAWIVEFYPELVEAALARREAGT